MQVEKSHQLPAGTEKPMVSVPVKPRGLWMHNMHLQEQKTDDQGQNAGLPAQVPPFPSVQALKDWPIPIYTEERHLDSVYRVPSTKHPCQHTQNGKTNWKGI